MTANTVNGSGNGARSGAQTLVLLVSPLNVPVLRALSEGPKQMTELRREAGSPARTTLRAQLKRLAEIDAIEKRQRNQFPGVLEYELTEAGRGLLFVAAVLERWLTQAPDGALPLECSASKAATKALAEGWSTAMLRALAAGPLSLTELDGVISSLSYPSLERRLASLRLAGQIEAQPSAGRGTPYTVTSWLRQGVAPLAAAARWERRYQPQLTAPIRRLDIEAAFLLALPLLEPPQGMDGSCRMAAELSNGRTPRLAGVMASIEAEARMTCTTDLRGNPDAWVHGSTAAWLDAVIENDVDRLELGGDCQLCRALLDGLHAALFSTPISAKVDANPSFRDDGAN